jgi:hypothetical protein
MMMAVVISVAGFARPSSLPFCYYATPAFLSSRFVHTQSRQCLTLPVSLLLCRKRFGKARARLAQLQAQLDSIIQDMPPPNPGLFTFLAHGFRDLHCVAAFIAHPARRDICS